MAWMKIDLELSDKPEVHYIANALNLDPDAVVGKLIRVWQWFDKHTTDGNAHGVTYSLVDRITCVTGFGEMMNFAGWLQQNDKHLTMPKFDRHTSQSAKNRAVTAERVSKHRNDCVTLAPLQKSYLEKIREEVNNTKPTAPKVADVRFEEFWAAYPKKIGRGAAEKAWAKADAEIATVRAALENQKRSEQWQKDGGQFVPNPATWLNQKRWLDGDKGQSIARQFPGAI